MGFNRRKGRAYSRSARTEATVPHRPPARPKLEYSTSAYFSRDCNTATLSSRPTAAVQQVYHQVSIDALVDGCAKDSEKDEEVAGRRLSDRLREPGCLETRLVALRLLGRISAEEFTVGIEGYGGQVRGWLKAGRGLGSRCVQFPAFSEQLVSPEVVYGVGVMV